VALLCFVVLDKVTQASSASHVLIKGALEALKVNYYFFAGLILQLALDLRQNGLILLWHDETDRNHYPNSCVITLILSLASFTVHGDVINLNATILTALIKAMRISPLRL
jgi:hypothetical protein